MLPESEIGEHIRGIRRAKGLTLDSLARKTGFSKGYLSKVENADKAPPVSTLVNIAKALQVSISEIFGETREPVSFSLVKRNERPLMARDGTVFGYAYETLAHNFPHKHMEPYVLTIPKEVRQHPLFQHSGEEMLMILKGTLRFMHGDKGYLLEEGDCVYFDSGVPHRSFAVSDEGVKCLMVIYTP